MELPESREDISVEKVREITNNINSAECAGFMDNGLDFTAKGTDMNGEHEVVEVDVNKGMGIYARLKGDVDNAFPETIDRIQKTTEKLLGKLFLILDQKDPNNVLLKVSSGTAINRTLRQHPVYFELNFGNHRETAKQLVNLVTENPLVIKSVMERVFSPTSNPQDSYLRGNMNTLDRDNISPFVNLPRVSNVQTKVIN